VRDIDGWFGVAWFVGIIGYEWGFILPLLAGGGRGVVIRWVLGIIF